MTINVNLVGDTLPVIVDDRTAGLGGSFYYEPLRVYSACPHTWAWEQLQQHETAVLLDVGASTGCYALLAAHHPGLKVFAFEPVPKSAEVLRENVRLNDLEGRVRVYERGISNYDGYGIIHVVYPEGGSGVSILDGTPRPEKECVDKPVQVMTIDTFCEGLSIIPTLIKIDVEGGERMVLEGAARTIQQYHPQIIAEYEPMNTAQYGYNPHEITDLLEAWGYSYTNPEGNDVLATWKGTPE